MSWDPLNLLYQPEEGPASGQELPLRLLVLGDFGTRMGAQDLHERKVATVTRENLAEVMADAGITMSLVVDDRLLDDDTPHEVELHIAAIADFEPDALINNVPQLRDVHAFMGQIRQLKAQAGESGAGLKLDGLDDGQLGLLRTMGIDPASVDDALLDYVLAELTERLSRQMDALLHHPAFQTLESAWRGLAYLVGRTDDHSPCQIDMLDVSKEDLADDFKAAAEVQESNLFQVLYAEEFGQYGGTPYAATIAAFGFGPGEADITLLRGIADVSAMAHAPFIAAASPKFFGVKRHQDISGLSDLLEVFRGPTLATWREFIKEPSARYLGLVVPRVLLRDAHDYRRGGVSSFPYEEDIASSNTEALWGSGAFAFATCLMRSFEQFRVCVDILGEQGGRVEGLAERHLRGSSEGIAPTEVLISETKEAEIADLGFIPISTSRAHRRLAFFSANSVRWGHVRDLLPNELGGDPLGERLGSQLPYLFLVSRIAHYVKVLQRDTIGAVKDVAELQSELMTWLRQYVSDVENPEPSVRARRPLRRANLDIRPPDDGKGLYRMRLQVTPHVKHMGQSYELSVEGELG